MMQRGTEYRQRLCVGFVNYPLRRAVQITILINNFEEISILIAELLEQGPRHGFHPTVAAPVAVGHHEQALTAHLTRFRS